MTDLDGKGVAEGAAKRIVVGVDDTPSSHAALRWAVAQARLTGLPLLVVHAWTCPTYPYVDQLVVQEVAEREAERILAEAVRDGVGSGNGLRLDTQLVHGHPARALARLGRSASMLVVGAGGHGELAGLLLGSVGLHLATHAPVPVVIVPAPSAPGPRLAESAGNGGQALAMR
jgi:nucleotide-binding universal stress UspA family protein